jgi:hypothetical protein
VCVCACVGLGCGAVFKHQSIPFHVLFLGTEEQQPAANSSSEKIKITGNGHMEEAGFNRSNTEV